MHERGFGHVSARDFNVFTINKTQCVRWADVERTARSLANQHYLGR